MSTTLETMSLQEVRENLSDLVKAMVKGKGRVEFVESGERFVILCKDELDSLEKAINILSDTTEFRDICSSMNQLAAATSPAAMA
jgi:PHD/YefM family antitoxin component YafN of YafNO toxin-antitoxin module